MVREGWEQKKVCSGTGEPETASKVLRRRIMNGVNRALLMGGCHPVLSSSAEQTAMLVVMVVVVG